MGRDVVPTPASFILLSCVSDRNHALAHSKHASNGFRSVSFPIPYSSCCSIYSRSRCARGPVSTLDDAISARVPPVPLPQFEVALLPGPCLVLLRCGQGRLIINQSSLCPGPSVWARPQLPRPQPVPPSPTRPASCLFHATTMFVCLLIVSGLWSFD